MPDLKPLGGHLALVTGGTGGIGRATCEALAAEGCDVAVHYHQASDAAKSLSSRLASTHNIRVQAFQADLSGYEDVKRLHSDVVKALGHPTILFNNAGNNGGKTGVKDISEVSIEMFEKTWRANCGHTFLLTQLCLPAMLEKSWGRVVFCSSVAGFTGGVVGPHYASSKAALHGMIHWLASAYAKRGITINGVAPALITGTSMLPGTNEELEMSKSPVRVSKRPDVATQTRVWSAS